jgi:hypothetical protein
MCQRAFADGAGLRLPVMPSPSGAGPAPNGSGLVLEPGHDRGEHAPLPRSGPRGGRRRVAVAGG